MKQFARRIPSEEILHQGGAKISWRAIKLLIDKTDNLEEHMWYTQQCLENGWSSTVLSHQIESGLYYRQALADKTTNFKAQLANPFSEQAEEIIKVHIFLILYRMRKNLEKLSWKMPLSNK